MKSLSIPKLKKSVLFLCGNKWLLWIYCNSFCSKSTFSWQKFFGFVEGKIVLTLTFSGIWWVRELAYCILTDRSKYTGKSFILGEYKVIFKTYLVLLFSPKFSYSHQRAFLIMRKVNFYFMWKHLFLQLSDRIYMSLTKEFRFSNTYLLMAFHSVVICILFLGLYWKCLIPLWVLSKL